MGRTFLAEDCVQSYIENLFNESSCKVGVIIGQLTAHKDYVIHMVKTPREEGTNQEKALSLESVDDSWVAKHAKQVENMMPGGLYVIGVFVIAPPDMLKNAQHKLRQLIFAVHRSLSKSSSNTMHTADSAITDRVALQIDSVSRKLTCRTFDVADNNSSARPADWKYQSFADRWLSLSCSLALDLRISVTNSMGSKSLKRQIQTGLKNTCDGIRNSMGLLNRQHYADDDLLDASQGGKKKAKLKDDTTQRHFDVTLLTQMANKEVSDPVCEECCAKMLLRGTVQCRAYVNSKATAKQALDVLKSDAVRTLLQRCDLLCEDLLVDEEEQDPRIVYETPRRVFTALPGLPTHADVCVCDYVFVDETARESRDRLRELLDIDVKEEDIDMECETLPEDKDLIKPEPESLPDVTSESKSNPDTTKQNTIPYMGLLLGGAVAALGSALSYMYLSDTIP